MRIKKNKVEKDNIQNKINLANEFIKGLCDYITLTRIKPKLKVNNVDLQTSEIVEFIKNNLGEL